VDRSCKKQKAKNYKETDTVTRDVISDKDESLKSDVGSAASVRIATGYTFRLP
jgi:hypothetical protein